MSKSASLSRYFYSRIALFTVIGAIALTIAAAGTNAAGFSFMDSVKGLFGMASVTTPIRTPAPVNELSKTANLLAPATKPMFFSGDTVYDSFADGDFTFTPVWGGNTTSWQIVVSSDAAAGATGSNTLRLNAPATAQTDYLSSQISSWGASQEWGAFIGRRAQALTAANQQFLWLYANESNLTSATVDGYRLAMGDDTGADEIRLEYIVNGAVSSTVITSTGSFPNSQTDFGFLVRVTRSSSGSWELFTSTLPNANGTGAIASSIPNSTNATTSQGTGTNNSLVPSTNGYLGAAALHSTGASAIITAEFDQIYFTGTAAPTVTSISPASGPAAGGTAVTITGTNLTGASAVTIGGAVASSIVVAGDGLSLTAVTGARAAASGQSVVVTTPGGTNTANTLYSYLSPPSISKSFATSPINVGGTSLLTITVTNPNSSTALTGVGFTDTLPTGLTAADVSGSNCGGSFTISGNVFTLSGATVTNGAPCTSSFSVTANGAATGVLTNNTSTVTSTNGGTGNSASANITVNTPAPTVTGISPDSGPAAGGTAVTITGTNFTGATLVTIGGTTCVTGTVTATTIACTTGARAAGSASVNVTTAAGTNGNNSLYSYVDPPTISKSFGTSPVIVGGTSLLTITIANPNSLDVLSGVAYTDTLPTGLTTPDVGSTPACNGTYSITSNVVTFTNGLIPTNGSCPISMTVTANGSATGVLTNNTSTVTSTNGGTGNFATANITVNQAPAITSANNTTFTVGAAGTFTATATGFPAPTFSTVSTLPSGV
ncbi:MAG: beta strand repeat-containing protein, partial [Pyrinomonadaceae bacterium]